METPTHNPTVKGARTKWLELAWNILLIFAGSLLCALAINGILIPQHFLSGGFTGLALIIHYLDPRLPLGLIYFVINIPVFLMGWKLVGRRFFFYSLAGMLIFSLTMQVVHVRIEVNDPILAALLAGIIVGSGSGIILRSLGSAGGPDILPVILLKLYSIRVGNTTLTFNSVILCAAAILFTLDGALYTLVYLYVSANFMNLVVTGLSKRKSILIISEKWPEIARGILRKERRGLTIIEGRGAYSGGTKNILYTVIAFQDLPQLKNLIRAIDPDAFVVVMDTLEVMGHRMGNQPHW